MNFKYEIVDLDIGQSAKFYTLRLIDSEKTEFEKFLDDPNFINDPVRNEFVKRLNDIAERYGCSSQFFRDESTRDNPICAYFHSDSDLRLYCIRMRHTLLIIGGGGLKTTGTYQEDPHLYDCVKLLEDFWKRFDPLIQSGDIDIDVSGRIHGQKSI